MDIGDSEDTSQLPGSGLEVQPSILSTSVTVPTDTEQASKNNFSGMKCEMRLVLASTQPPTQQIMVETLPTICFPFFDPAKLQPIDLSVALPVTRMTIEHGSLQNLMKDKDSSFMCLPESLRLREMVSSSHCRNQLRLARKNALFKLGVPCWSGQKKLLAAVRNADFATVIHLLQEGIDPNTSDDKKRTPLHIAASQGLDHIVSLLVAMKADPNRRDILGNTPLHLAACRGDTRTVRVLIGHGTDVHLKDSVGRTPLCIVKSRLKTLRKDRSISTDKLISECQMISYILKAHSKQLPDCGSSSVDALCNLMENVSTREQADEIADAMVERMSHLCIANSGQSVHKEEQLSNLFSLS